MDLNQIVDIIIKLKDEPPLILVIITIIIMYKYLKIDMQKLNKLYENITFIKLDIQESDDMAKLAYAYFVMKWFILSLSTAPVKLDPNITILTVHGYITGSIYTVKKTLKKHNTSFNYNFNDLFEALSIDIRNIISENTVKICALEEEEKMLKLQRVAIALYTMLIEGYRKSAICIRTKQDKQQVLNEIIAFNKQYLLSLFQDVIE